MNSLIKKISNQVSRKRKVEKNTHDQFSQLKACATTQIVNLFKLIQLALQFISISRKVMDASAVFAKI